MPDPSNVVSLGDRRVDEPQALPRLIRDLKGNARQHLRVRFEDLFNNLDDALFELADRASSDLDQNLYFDAMRTLRLERQPLAQRFDAEFAAGFDLLHGAAPGDADDADDIDFDAIDLVDAEDMEVDVAKAGIISKATGLYAVEIAQLTQRLAVVFPACDLNERSNPLAPTAVCDAFARASADLDLDIRIRLILLKLFERYVIEQLAAFYTAANKQLADAGVLKHARDFRRVARERRAANRAQPAGGDTAHEGAATDATTGMPLGATTPADERKYAQLTDLLHAAIHAGTAAPAITAAPAGTGGGAAVPTAALLSQLHLAQAQHGSWPTLSDASPPRALNVAALLDTGAGQHLQQHDADVVNLVGMLFDYILNDRNLAIPMKALLGRLQIPIIKVALQDKTFFTRSRHPARQLLNELSSAGIGWSSAAELKRDALYSKIESIVARVLNDFETDVGLFPDLLEELREFVSQDARRARIVEQRTRDAELGRARTRAARSAVNRLVAQKASGMTLDTAVQRFIAEHWTRVLTFVHLRDGDESERWYGAIASLDELLTAAGACEDARESQRRKTARPALLRRLAEGLDWIGMRGADSDRAIAALDMALRATAEHDQPPVDHPHWQPARLPIEEIVLASEPGMEEVDPQVEPALLARIDAMPIGAWIEVRDPGRQTVRCRLVARVDDEQRLVFVNRRGMKVAERTRLDLAAALQAGHAVLLDDAEVFDRALQSVIGDLRRGHDRR